MKGIALLAMLLFAPTAAFADDVEGMRKAASEFYAVILPDTGGLPDAATRARIQPLVTPALGQLLSDAASAEARFAAVNKNAPPLMEGDIFASLFEGATSFAIDGCEAATGRCTVALVHDDKSGKPTRWSDTLCLVNTASGWRVDDIAYGGQWAYANSGRLTDSLKQVVKNVAD